MHALAAITTADGDGVDLGDLHAEQYFNSLGDVDLGGIGSDLEGVLLVSDPAMEFSVMTASNDVLCELHHAYTSSSFLAASNAEDQLVGVDNIVGVDAGSGGLDTGDVGGALDELGVQSVIDDQVLLACADSGQESNDGLGLVLVAAILSTTIMLPLAALSDRALSRARRLTFLLMVVVVAAGLGAQSNAAVGPLRSTDGALTSVAGALLAPRLLAAAADFLADLGVLGALALVGQEVDDCLVDSLLVGVIPNTASESSTVETFLPFISTTSNCAIVFSSLRFHAVVDGHDRALGAGDRTLNSDQIVLGVDLDNGQVLHGNAHRAHVAGQTLAGTRETGLEVEPLEPA